MSEYTYINLREKKELKETAANWFHDKWGVPTEAYLECMDAYLSGTTEYGWYLCLDGDRIVGGLGVIENDVHDRKDLYPNVCAVYTEEEYRCKGIAGHLLDLAVNAEVIKKSGAWFSYDGNRIAQGRDNAKNFLRDNPEIAQKVEDELKASSDKFNFSKTTKARAKAMAEKAEEQVETTVVEGVPVNESPRTADVKVDVLVEE